MVKPPYFPPKAISDPIYTLVLDMDETLIHSPYQCVKLNYKYERQLQWASPVLHKDSQMVSSHRSSEMRNGG